MKIKFCGMVTEQDIKFCNMTKPDLVGFVFVESRWRLSADNYTKLSALLDSSIVRVGVFRDEAIENVVRFGFDYVELFGSETSEYIAKLKELTPVQVIKRLDLNETDTNADFILFDNVENGIGGTGKTLDLSSLPKTNKPIFLAGGINSDNIERFKALNPYGISVTSGIETNGVKDLAKMKELIDYVR